MEDWVHRALARWPDVPALYGWLALDRRGRWRIRGEPITRPQIVDTINRNYAADADGRWFFQNGPQRGYMRLEVAPLVLHAEGETLRAHTGVAVTPAQAYLDEEGSLLLATAEGAAALADTELDWALARITKDGAAIGEDALAAALALPSGTGTGLQLRVGAAPLPLRRLDRARAEAALGFVRDPRPRPGERAVVGGPEDV